MTHADTLEIFPYFLPSNTVAVYDVQIYDWCEDQFGEFRPEKEHSSISRWCTGFRGYYFKNEQDYILAVLRWK